MNKNHHEVKEMVDGLGIKTFPSTKTHTSDRKALIREAAKKSTTQVGKSVDKITSWNPNKSAPCGRVVRRNHCLNKGIKSQFREYHKPFSGQRDSRTVIGSD